MEVKLDIRDNKLSYQSKDLVKIDLVKETGDIKKNFFSLF